MKKECGLCGNYEDVAAENNFGFRYLCRDCGTFLFIRYNPVIYTFEEAKKRINDVLNRMKEKFADE